MLGSGWLFVQGAVPGQIVRQVLGGDTLEAGDPAFQPGKSGIGVLNGRSGDTLLNWQKRKSIPSG